MHLIQFVNILSKSYVIIEIENWLSNIFLITDKNLKYAFRSYWTTQFFEDNN